MRRRLDSGEICRPDTEGRLDARPIQDGRLDPALSYDVLCSGCGRPFADDNSDQITARCHDGRRLYLHEVCNGILSSL